MSTDTEPKAPIYPSIETMLSQMEYEYDNWGEGCEKDKALLDVAIVALKRLTRRIDD